MTGYLIAAGVFVCALLGGHIASLRQRLKDAERAAMTDPLTGLLNRDGLSREFEQLAVAAGQREHIGVAIVDMDQFKLVNDTVGHSIGDDVIRQAARRLEGSRVDGRPVCAARLGGDEFALVFRLTAQALVTGSALDELAAAIEPPVGLGAVHTRLTAGFATAPAVTADLSALLGEADAAMYRAKRDGSGVQSYWAGHYGRNPRSGRSAVRTRDRSRDRQSIDAEVAP